MAPVASTSPATSSFLLVLLFQSILLGLLSQSVTAELQQVMIETGVLTVGQSLYNLERNYMLIMEGDCNLALYGGSELLWKTGTGGKGTDCRTEFQRVGGDVYLVVRSPSQNIVIWQQPNRLPETNYVLVVQPDRNVVIYSEATWSTKTSLQPVSHLPGDQALIGTETLEDGQYLIDRQHNYKFILKDCNLVLYDGTAIIWQSNTEGAGSRCRASLNNAGNLVVRDYRGIPVWTSNNRVLGDNHALVLQPDRNLVVYTKPVWNTGTYIPKRAANLTSGNEEDAGLAAGRKTMIHMVTNKQAA